MKSKRPEMNADFGHRLKAARRFSLNFMQVWRAFHRHVTMTTSFRHKRFLLSRDAKKRNNHRRRNQIHRTAAWIFRSRRLHLAGMMLAAGVAQNAFCAGSSDPLLDLFIKKGYVTEDEAARVKAEADALRTNEIAAAGLESKWKISKGIKSIELFGDLQNSLRRSQSHGSCWRGN